jgi:hypothetical protein
MPGVDPEGTNARRRAGQRRPDPPKHHAWTLAKLRLVSADIKCRSGESPCVRTACRCARVAAGMRVLPGQRAFVFPGGVRNLSPMTERRYTEDEIASIFHVAAKGPSAPPQHASRADGLTLADLQAIGGEVGIAPDAVARAAQTLEVRQGAVSRTFLGLPIGVERRVALRRRLTDEEWEHLVVQLRDVFKARGSTKSDGSLRQWTNGNLYALLEPTPSGHRLRLGSLHGGAATSLRLGFAALAGMSVLAIANLFGMQLVSAGTIGALLGGGVALVANAAFRLPGWARLRGRQMEEVAAQLALPPGSTTLPEPQALPPAE